MEKVFLLFALLMTSAIPSGLWAQQAGYSETNLVSNTAGVAKTTDPQLLNPWGISFVPGQDFWIANNNSGTSTLYDNLGNKDTGLVVTMPGATSNPNGNCSPGCPTGTVANSSGSSFGGGQFIFDTEDGLIASWTGASNTATVALDNSATSVFSSVLPAAAVGSPDFTLSLSAQSITVMSGASANLMIGASAVGGFNGQITLSCTSPAGLTCALSPTTITPGSSAASSTLTVSAAATPPVQGYGLIGVGSLLPGLGLFGTLLKKRRRKPLSRKSIVSMSALGLLLLISMVALGCGGGSTAKGQTPASQTTVMVTGTSGTLSHTSPVTITVN